VQALNLVAERGQKPRFEIGELLLQDRDAAPERRLHAFVRIGGRGIAGQVRSEDLIRIEIAREGRARLQVEFLALNNAVEARRSGQGRYR